MQQQLGPTDALPMILTIRQSQIAQGYDAAHDDGHSDGELGLAAVAILQGQPHPWKPVPFASQAERVLHATALLLAEAERLLRLEPKQLSTMAGS